MAFVRTLAAWLLVALWLPAASHLHLEHLGVGHAIHPDHVREHAHHLDAGSAASGYAAPGHHQHGSAHAADADGECLIVHAGSCLEAPIGVGASPGLALQPAGLAMDSRLAPVVPLRADLPLPPPPGPGSSWHFLLRAALPVRAPSIAS